MMIADGTFYRAVLHGCLATTGLGTYANHMKWAGEMLPGSVHLYWDKMTLTIIVHSQELLIAFHFCCIALYLVLSHCRGRAFGFT